MTTFLYATTLTQTYLTTTITKLAEFSSVSTRQPRSQIQLVESSYYTNEVSLCEQGIDVEGGGGVQIIM